MSRWSYPPTPAEVERSLTDVDDALEEAVEDLRHARIHAAALHADAKAAYHRAKLALAASGEKLTADLRDSLAYEQTAALDREARIAEALVMAGVDLLRALDAQVRARQSLAAGIRAVTTDGRR